MLSVLIPALRALCQEVGLLLPVDLPVSSWTSVSLKSYKGCQPLSCLLTSWGKGKYRGVQGSWQRGSPVGMGLDRDNVDIDCHLRT